MLRSMTGFGTAQSAIEGIEYAVEIRSVNHRYCKVVVRLPELWSSAEADVEAIIKAKVLRGSVTVAVRMRIPEDKAVYKVNSAALQHYVNQLKVLEIEADPTFRIDLGTLLQLPGVCELPSSDEICGPAHDGLMALVEKALGQLVDMRQTEGESVKRDLLKQCKVIEESLTEISRLAPKVVGDYHQRLTARVQELLSGQRVTIEPADLAREVAMYAERCDIAEEITRLTSHLVEFRKSAKLGGPAGRKLDFIAQEMLREANTIASKSNDAEIGNIVVEIKTAVDRIKEQAANVE